MYERKKEYASDEREGRKDGEDSGESVTKNRDEMIK